MYTVLFLNLLKFYDSMKLWLYTYSTKKKQCVRALCRKPLGLRNGILYSWTDRQTDRQKMYNKTGD